MDGHRPGSKWPDGHWRRRVCQVCPLLLCSCASLLGGVSWGCRKEMRPVRSLHRTACECHRRCCRCCYCRCCRQCYGGQGCMNKRCGVLKDTYILLQSGTLHACLQPSHPTALTPTHPLTPPSHSPTHSPSHPLTQPLTHLPHLPTPPKCPPVAAIGHFERSQVRAAGPQAQLGLELAAPPVLGLDALAKRVCRQPPAGMAT